jgi:hypothetical protein
MFIACSKNKSNMMIYFSQGIPNENQAFSYMYFKTEKEGYLLGTLTKYQEMSDADLNNSKFIPKSTEEANIYKTIDGGHSWEKIDSTLNKTYYGHGVFYKNCIYIQEMNSLINFKNSIIKFDVLKKRKSTLNYNFERLGDIWSIDDSLFVTFKNKRVNGLLSFDENLNIINSKILKTPLKNEVLNFRKESYAMNWDNNNLLNLTQNKTIPLPLNPGCLTSQDENNILIAGNKKTDDSEINLVSYNVTTGKSKVIKEFKGYSIIQGLQSNDKLIAGFIGNISGAFTKYDLFYSLNKGKTWSIQKLEEPSYIRPSCLIDNIIYIYSGNARMQKLVLLSR